MVPTDFLKKGPKVFKIQDGRQNTQKCSYIPKSDISEYFFSHKSKLLDKNNINNNQGQIFRRQHSQNGHQKYKMAAI